MKPPPSPTHYFVPDDLQARFDRMELIDEQTAIYGLGYMSVKTFITSTRSLAINHTRLDDGWIAAFNAGEWGGLILWLPDDTSYQTLGIIRPDFDNGRGGDFAVLKQSLYRNNRLITLTRGYIILPDDKEYLTIYDRVGNKFERVNKLVFPDRVKAFDILHDEVVLLIKGRLSRMNVKDSEVRPILPPETVFWKAKSIQYLRPDLIALGGTDFLALVHLKEGHPPRIDRYAPDHCALL